MHRLIDRFHRDERGATATEYALLIVFVALAITVGATTLGGGLNTLFSKIGTQLSNVTLPPFPQERGSAQSQAGGPSPTGHTGVTSGMERGVQTVIVVLAMGAFISAAYVDVRRRRIPNALSYMIGSLGLLRILLAGDPMTAGWTLAAAAGVLVVGFMFFWGGTLGGGDAKLLTGAVLLIGYHDLFGFLFLMSLFGAVLALALLIGDRLIPRFRRVGQPAVVPGATAAAASRHVWPTVPYGVAISAAGMIILVLQFSVPR